MASVAQHKDEGVPLTTKDKEKLKKLNVKLVFATSEYDEVVIEMGVE
eukprot:CAMPEP_0184291482 /NCGR_PEP_ID=MMETSP1049-20130417/3504_1 /TAXON_ID=77928 /ORGANISM="Proteomonas sulcata, Strain CCMP704" /LENGTH=46 /DNA_ID= /DNA_START= /DNA_END= /DNA_ORIENTATION=